MEQGMAVGGADLRDRAGVHAAIAGAHEAFRHRHPASAAHYLKAREVMPGGNTRSILFHKPFPLVIARGASSKLWDLDGHSFVNFLGEYTAGLFGHSHPIIRRALDKALDTGINLSAHTESEARFAQAVCDRFPSVDLVRFTNSGSEATLMAVAAATAITKRRKILVFDGAYHGGFLNFSGGPIATNVPHDFLIAAYNDVEGTADLLKKHGTECAAILVEPMLGAGGCVPAERAFLEMLRAEASRCGALLIFDEVMTSRLGKGGVQGATGIHADLTTLGKYIGGGMSFGAFGGARDIMKKFDPSQEGAFAHAGTFNNNPLTMTAGIAGLTDIYTAPVAEMLMQSGEVFRSTLNALVEAANVPMQFTGLGSLATVHFTEAPIRSAAHVRAADQDLKELFFFHMLAKGIYLARRGMYALSLEISPHDCQTFVAAVEQFVDEHRILLGSRKTSH